MSRLLAVDYGRRRVGIAVTDPMQIIAGGLDTVDEPRAVAFILDYSAKNDVEKIIVGMPRQMNGEVSESFQYIEPFVAKLRAALDKVSLSGIEIIYYDERFTSKLAMQTMISGGMKKSDRRNKANIDRISAAIILQSYMESAKPQIPGLDKL